MPGIQSVKNSARRSLSAFLGTDIGKITALGVKKVDPEIQELTKKVIEAANGKPLKTSITGQQRKQRLMAPLIKHLVARSLSGDGQQNGKATQGSGSNGAGLSQPASSTPQAKPANKGGGSTEQAVSVITPEDILALRQSIDTLSSGLAAKSK